MLFVLSALAADCQARLDTWVDYRPQPSETTWEYPGGWDKKRLSAFPAHRVAQAELDKTAFKRFPAEVQDDLLNGILPDVDGLGEVALKLAWGEPDLFWETDRGCRALLYGERNPPEVVDTCDGLIVERHTLVAPIACTRLDAVAPRLKKAGLDALDRSQQVDLVAGIPGVWMDEAWLETAFGKPSEKTRNRRVYLDDRGLKGDLRVDLDQAGYAAHWEWASGAKVGGILSSKAPEQEAHPGPAATAPRPAPDAPSPEPRDDRAPAPSPAPRPAPARVDSLPAERGPTGPAIQLPTGRHTLAGTCGSDGLSAKVDLSPDGTFSVSARLDHGVSTSIAVYRTTGYVRGTEDRIAFEGLGSGVLKDGALRVTLGPWPVAACSGAVLEPVPGR